MFSGIWLVYLIQPVIDLFHHHGVLWIAGGLVITVAFCVIYMPTLMYHDNRPRLALAGLVAIAVLAALACVVYGKDWTPLWIYVSAATGMVLAPVASRAASGFLAVLGVSAAYLVCCWISHLDIGNTLAVLLPVVLIGLAMIGFRMQITLMRELAQARGDRRQAGRERGAAPAGPGHARPDRPVPVDDHAEVRAGRQAPGQAAVLGRARRGTHRTR